MFANIQATENSNAIFSPVNSKKSPKVKIKKIVKNTLVLAYNSQTGAVFTKKGGNKKFNFNGHEIGISAYLKPEYIPSTKQCIIGLGTSDDPNNNFAAASLTINFLDSVPVGGERPRIYSGPRKAVWTGYIESTDFFLDLKALAGGYRYCHIQVNTAPNSPDNLLIEGNVYIYLSLSSNYKGQPQIIYADETVGVNNYGVGSSRLSVMNPNVYFDISQEPQAYLIPMIGVSGSNPYKFDVGDPKRDAEVEVEEV